VSCAGEMLRKLCHYEFILAQMQKFTSLMDTNQLNDFNKEWRGPISGQGKLRH